MLAPNANNYLYGKGRVYFKPTGSTGLIDLGNVPKFEMNVEVTKAEHFSSRSGTKQKDLSVVTESKASANLDIEEYSIDNLDLAFLGDGVQSSSQSDSYVSGSQVTIAEDRFVELGKLSISTVKLTHGTVTNGSFAVGDTVVGGTSAATGKIGWVGSGYIEAYNVTGTFTSTEVITSSAKTATLTNAEVVEDIIVGNDSTPSTRYVRGTDYDLDVVSGLLRVLSAGAISASSVYVWFDHAAKTLKSVRALANTERSGALMFVGDPDVGPKFKIDVWKCTITIGGAAGFISDDIQPIPMTVDVLADTANHPSEPFFRVTEIS